MYLNARSALIRSCWPDGLFAGMLDAQHPVFFQEKGMRDSYWSATFEIPSILGKYVQSTENPIGIANAEALLALLPHPAASSVQHLELAKKLASFPDITDKLS